ncbi:hypothetical protein DL991_37655 [Amycolatopsis sp. WAC 01375]|uniref:hypothetical protein n=1 Tax=unclassified Amycolatopsis TaxID=2618356 RepID=UPI000F783396|nr:MULTISPECIES: hypothetical protein [unclassified Amycolatopsis]RSM70388.1 hypothetical protein DL991_37655 [Amycolatopsis sp. WAC 01375]RSN29407.1 hypothetical protein DL990_24665 [Amycolatopsis sp. WAC 01416]
MSRVPASVACAAWTPGWFVTSVTNGSIAVPAASSVRPAAGSVSKRQVWVLGFRVSCAMSDRDERRPAAAVAME